MGIQFLSVSRNAPMLAAFVETSMPVRIWTPINLCRMRGKQRLPIATVDRTSNTDAPGSGLGLPTPGSDLDDRLPKAADPGLDSFAKSATWTARRFCSSNDGRRGMGITT